MVDASPALILMLLHNAEAGSKLFDVLVEV